MPGAFTVSHDVLVDSQFGPRANAYVTSAVHASGPDLDALEDIARLHRPERALDLCTGGGHVAYRLSAHAREVVACDLSEAMLTAVADEAKKRELNNIVTAQCSVDRLAFGDATFDFLACRYAAHHWRRFDQGLREARRVLTRGAVALFMDVISPSVAVLDTHLQAVELLRDPSHVRDRSLVEWQSALERAGFSVRTTRSARLRLEFASWVERMRTPEPMRAAIRGLQKGAPEDVVGYFGIASDGSFTVDTLMLEVVAE